MDTNEAMMGDAPATGWGLFDPDRIEVLRGTWVSGADDDLRAAALGAVTEALLDDDQLSLFDVVPGLAGCPAWTAAPIELVPTGVEPLTERTRELLAGIGATSWGAVLHLTAEVLLGISGLGFNGVVGIVSAVLEAAWLLVDDAEELCPDDTAVSAVDEHEHLGELWFEAMAGPELFGALCLGDATIAVDGDGAAPGEGPTFGLGSSRPLAALFPELGRIGHFVDGLISWCPQGIDPVSPWTIRLLEDLGIRTWGCVMVMLPSELMASRWWDPTEQADLLRFMADVADAIVEPTG